MPVATTAPKSNHKDRSTPPHELPPFKYAERFDKPVFGDWRDDISTKGYAVVKGSIPTDRALAYREHMFQWLESFPLGFDRNDSTTWKNEHLPVHMKGGMFHGYGFAHLDFVWDIRCEPGVIDAFAKVWGTNELITSFDGGCLMLPKRTDVKDGGKWEHMDQSHHRSGFYCCQGIANLNYNGPDDGGLMVLEGSNQLVQEFFDIHGRDSYKTWGPFDWYGFTDEQQEWFYSRGCKWTKVCADPGDLILWDSRTMHYNVRPNGDRDRVVTYVCMAPSSLLSDEDREIRRIAFENYRGTTHVPFAAIYSRPHEPKIREDGQPCPYDTGIPAYVPKLNPTLLKLAGAELY
ncbi:hypothetical protein IAR50_000639 [Cryptococcus sp. DSM 104548]